MNKTNPLTARAGKRLTAFDQLPIGMYAVPQSQANTAGEYTLFLEQEGRIVVLAIRRKEILTPLLISAQIEILVSDEGATIRTFVEDVASDTVVVNSPAEFTLYPSMADEETSVSLDPNIRYSIDHAFLKEKREYLILRTEDGETMMKEFPSAEELSCTFEQVIAYPGNFELRFENRDGTYTEVLEILRPA